MESSTAARESTGSRTIADMMGLAAERFGDHPALTFKRGDEWAEVSYREVGEIVSEVARGLIDLGLAPGERAAVLCSTRPEWTYASFGITSAGGVVVPIYPTNSPEECEWVAGNSEYLVAAGAIIVGGALLAKTLYERKHTYDAQPRDDRARDAAEKPADA